MQLDLSRYWLMQWKFAALLSLAGWLAQLLSRWRFNKKYPGVRFRLQYSFVYRYLLKHLGIFPGNNLIAAYFFLYLIVIWYNLIWSNEIQTVVYYYLVSKLFLDPDPQNLVWVYFFCWAPLHPYIQLLLFFDCIKTIIQFLPIVELFPVKVLLMGIIFLANGYIIMQCEMQSLYLPFLWRITVSGWEYWFFVERIVLMALTQNSHIVQFFDLLSIIFIRLAMFCSIAGPVLKQVEADDKKLLDAVQTYMGQMQARRRQEMMEQRILNLQQRMALGSVSSWMDTAQLSQTIVPPLILDSSDDESETGYRVGKHLLRPRKPFASKIHYMNDNLELPGYNEEEDSNYTGNLVTDESDSDSTVEEMSRAECDLYG